MKKKITTRILSALLAAVMVFLMIPFSTIIIHANSANYTSTDSAIEKYRLDAINGTSSQILFDYIADSFNTESVQGSLQKTTTQKNLSAINKGLKIADSGIKLLSLVPGAKIASETVGDVLSGIEGITGEFIENDANAQLMDQMNAISVQVSELSNQIDAFAEANRAYMVSIVQSLKDASDLSAHKATLQEFANDIKGNDRFGEFQSYYSWQKQLYDRLDAVVQAEKNPAGAIQSLSYYYDRLYLVAKESDELYEYLIGASFDGGLTLQEVLYRYYLLNNLALSDEAKLTYREISEKCIDYSMDWYATYAMSQMCLNMCYIHQLEILMEKYPNVEFNSTTEFQSEAINNKTVIYSYKEICEFLTNPVGDTDAIEIELAKFYARILCLDEYYIYENGIYNDPTFLGEKFCYSVQYEEILESADFRADVEKTYGIDSKYYSRVNNLISTGDILYMSIFPETVMGLFDAKKISFESNNNELATVNNAGVVNVIGDKGNDFTISMFYDKVELYSMQFCISEREYSGGMGTESCPYLISSWNDILSIATNSIHCNKKNIHFKLTNDIDAQNANFTGIPSFSGTLDGNNYSVFRFAIYYNDYSTPQEKNTVGFIDVLNSCATVKNLSLGKAGEKLENSYGEYSAKIGTFYADSDAAVNVGGICGVNNGTIENCKIDKMIISGSQAYNVSNKGWLNVNVGAICGQNLGNINDIEVLNTSIEGRATSNKDNSPGKVVVRVGGIVGYHLSGTINSLYSHDNILTGYGYSVDENDILTDWNEGEAWVRIGGLAGQNGGSSVVENSYVYNNSIDPTGSSDDLNKQTGDYIGYIEGNSPVDCFVSMRPGFGTREDPTYSLDFYAYEYIRGERYLKSSFNESTKYSLQEHRIDTSNLGEATAIKLIHISENMYERNDIAVTVVAEEPQKLCVYMPPRKLTYARFDVTVDLSGLRLAMLYNNGTVVFLDAVSEPETGNNFIETFDFSNEGEANIILKYAGFTTNVTVTVNACTHKNVLDKPQVDPSCTEIGYTAGTYCNDCQAYINGHEEIPSLTEHPYCSWQKHNDNQHVRFCTCGAKEYENHDWGTGVETTPATHTTTGVKTYTCSACNATKTEVIDKTKTHTFDKEVATQQYLKSGATCTSPAVYYKSCECGEKGTDTFTYGTELGHTYGSWTNHNDTQHVHSCSCGAKEYENHDWNNGVITSKPTNTAQGEKLFTCKDCGATYKVPVNIPDGAPIIVIESNRAMAGKTVNVNIRLKNNPGIASMKLNVEYDSSVLKLVNVNYNLALGGQAQQPQNYGSPVILNWFNGAANTNGDMVFATLTFEVGEDVTVDETMISVTYDQEDIYNIDETNILFYVENGVIEIPDYIAGDINDDGIVNNKDLSRLFQHLSGWEVEVNENAIDVNGDRTVNNKDLTRLFQYLSGWDVEIC